MTAHFYGTKKYVLNVLQRPDLHQHHADLYAASVVLQITYGKPAPSSFEDPAIVAIHKIADRFLGMLKPGAYLVGRLPWLRYVPGYAPEIKRYRKEELEVHLGQVDATRRSVEEGSDLPSFVRYLVENPDSHGLDEETLAYLAGPCTTSVGMYTIVMAAALFPEEQEKVLAEIDGVFGGQKALRWRPILPICLYHQAFANFVWNGYHIPAGATIIGNNWGISRDTEVFPDPETFNPQRWLNDQGQMRPQNEIRFFTYGFGRRVCPGQYVASRSLFVTMSLLFWSFRISQDPSQPIDSNA
ncbi:cytochrome P450 [Coniophora puteana RWD-64-598 SS2]|uniref:Cytochrome P450 n=1 Tax=Coniophora puteana (strain RWD-64-598) TaxID=741705 RepID=A0A5M3MMX7_CONPW|nr:cytochrome P450 [Coniophora puteana RWD-64-598 SS2]EIW80542.1 cytochrome P450 [Coniophora puteana RWD-64-598 SS2]